MSNKKPRTVQEQVSKLKFLGMKFHDEDLAVGGRMCPVNTLW